MRVTFPWYKFKKFLLNNINICEINGKLKKKIIILFIAQIHLIVYTFEKYILC